MPKISQFKRKIEKVPRGIQSEKSSKDTASSKNTVSTIGTQASPKRGGRNQVSGRVIAKVKVDNRLTDRQTGQK